jgi:peptidoglycan/xylan/chitin deacetylase (PgdA/CDA1 family)
MTILCYHAVQPDWASPLAIEPAAFAEHVEWLVAHRRVLPLAVAVSRLDRSGLLPRGTTALTFDDGFAGVYRHALPTLASHGVPATVFLVAGTIGDPPQAADWIDAPPPEPVQTLTRDQVLEMQDSGFTFGSHGYSHQDLTGLSEEECLRELRDSRALLEDVIHRPVTFLAYPRGRHDGQVRRVAERAGYTHAFGLPETGEPAGRYSIPRVGIYPGNGPAALRIKLSRWYLPVRSSRMYPVLRRLSLKGPLPR